MLGITAVNYVCGRIIGISGTSRRLRLWVMTSAIVRSLGTLGFFQCFGFFEVDLGVVRSLLQGPSSATTRWPICL